MWTRVHEQRNAQTAISRSTSVYLSIWSGGGIYGSEEGEGADIFMHEGEDSLRVTCEPKFLFSFPFFFSYTNLFKVIYFFFFFFGSRSSISDITVG